MKNKLLIFILLALFSFPVAAQYESAIASENNVLPYAMPQTVVRNYDNKYTFSVHFDPRTRITRSTYGPYYSTGAGTLTLAISEALGNIIINDLTFAGDYAFFCGYYVDTNVFPAVVEGVIGSFYVPDFQAGTIAVNLHFYGDIEKFDKLVAYLDPNLNTYKVVALGWKYPNALFWSTSVSAIVEYDDFLTNVLSANPHFIASTPPTSVPVEWHYDLLLTEKEVVLVGYDITNERLCVRKAPRSNVLLSGDLDMLYFYDNGIPEVAMMTHSEYLKSGLIAVTYLHQTSTGKFMVRVRFIDLATMNMINSQEFKVLEKYDIIDLEYIPQSDHLVMLHPGASYDGTTTYNQFILLEPGTTVPYTTHALYHGNYNKWYTSLSRIDEDGYVATGYNHWHYQRLLPTYTTPSCYQHDLLNVDIIPNIQMDKTTVPLYSRWFPHTTMQPSYRIGAESFDIECEMP